MVQTGSRIALTANVTSLSRQYDEVLKLPWDLACRQEVRLTSAGQFDIRERFENDGCSVVFGSPQDALSNPWHCKQGGVAIVARNGMTLQRVQPVNEHEQKLVEFKRFVHAAVPVGNGKRVIHVISFYGFSGANQCPKRMAENEEMLNAIFQVLAVLGKVPILLLGDFNVRLGTSAAIQRASWMDVCKSCAASQGGAEPDPTCFVRSTSAGSRIDAAFANETATNLIGEAGVIRDCVPTHCPGALVLSLGDCSRRVIRSNDQSVFHWHSSVPAQMLKRLWRTEFVAKCLLHHLLIGSCLLH